MARLRTLTRELSYQPLPLYRDINVKQSVKLDLNSLFIRRPKETFFIHIRKNQLIAWGIACGDLVIVENADQPMLNDLFVIENQGQYKFYQFFNEIDGQKILFSLEANEPNLRINAWTEVNVAGVITNVVHQMRHRSAQVRYAA